MSERRTSVLVGAFLVGAVVIAIAGALFFAGGGLGAQRSKVIMAFDGSLRGLTIGAPIALRGVTIGQVTDIDLQDLTAAPSIDIEEITLDNGLRIFVVERDTSPTFAAGPSPGGSTISGMTGGFGGAFVTDFVTFSVAGASVAFVPDVTHAWNGGSVD